MGALGMEGRGKEGKSVGGEGERSMVGEAQGKMERRAVNDERKMEGMKGWKGGWQERRRRARKEN